MPAENKSDKSDLYHSEKTQCIFFESIRESPAIFQPADHSLDDISVAVSCTVKFRFPSFFSSFRSFFECLLGNVGLNASRSQILSNLFRIVSLVSYDLLRSGLGPAPALGDTNTLQGFLEKG